MAKQAVEESVTESHEETTEDVTESHIEVAEVSKAEPVTMMRLSLEDEVNTRFRVTVKQGVTREQCLDESFWAHVSMRMSPGDTITVRPDDMAWELVLHVVNVGPQFAHVLEKAFYNLKPPTPIAKLPSIYKVEFAGPIHKWRFLRDGKMMRDGFATEDLAQRAAAQHQMAVNRVQPK